MKKFILGLGTVASAVAPVAAVVACGTGNPANKHYLISMSPDASTPDRANIVVKLTGYISNSIADEIHSIIAESIAEKNAGTLTYTTMHIEIQDVTAPSHKQTIDITASPLDADHKDLTATLAMMGTSFDTLMTNARADSDLARFFVQSTPGTGTGSTGGSDGDRPVFFGGTNQSVDQVKSQLKTGAIRSYFISHKTKERYAQMFASAKTGVTMEELGFTESTTNEPTIITDLKSKGKTYTWTFNVNAFVINGVNDYLWIKPILTVEGQSVEEDYGFDVMPATGNDVYTDQGDLDAFAFPDLSTQYSTLSQAQIVTNFGNAEHISQSMSDIGISGVTIPHDCDLTFTVKTYPGTGDLVVVPHIQKTSEATVKKDFAEQHIKVKRTEDVSAMKNKLDSHTFESANIFATNFRTKVNQVHEYGTSGVARITFADLETAWGINLGISTANKAKYDLKLTFAELPNGRSHNTLSNIGFTIIPKATEHGVTLTNNTGTFTVTSHKIDTQAVLDSIKGPLTSEYDPSAHRKHNGSAITYEDPTQEGIQASYVLGYPSKSASPISASIIGDIQVKIFLTSEYTPGTSSTIRIQLILHGELAIDPSALTKDYSIAFGSTPTP